MPEDERDRYEVDQPETMLVFRAGTVLLGIPSQFVDALHAPPQATPVPLAPAYVTGVAVLRGEVIPLLDIALFLDLESTTEEISRAPGRQRGTSFERVAVVEVEGIQVGILCSEVRGIIPIVGASSSEGRVTKGRKLEKVVAKEVNTNQGVLVVLDLPKLLEDARVKL